MCFGGSTEFGTTLIQPLRQVQRGKTPHTKGQKKTHRLPRTSTAHGPESSSARPQPRHGFVTDGHCPLCSAVSFGVVYHLHDTSNLARNSIPSPLTFRSRRPSLYFQRTGPRLGPSQVNGEKVRCELLYPEAKPRIPYILPWACT